MDGDLGARLQLLPGFPAGKVDLVDPLAYSLKDAIGDPGWFPAKADLAYSVRDPLNAKYADHIQVGMHKQVTRKVWLYLPGVYVG